MPDTTFKDELALVGLDAKKQILAGASAGQNSGWQRISPNPERLLWQLDSGAVNTQFAVDVSADGDNSLGQAFTGSWSSSTVAEFSPPLQFTNPQARYFRVTVISGGPFSVYRNA